VVSDKTVPVPGELRLLVMTFDGKVLMENKANVDVAPLASKIYLQLPVEESLLAKGIDSTKVFVETELTVAGNVVSSNLIYLAPTVEIHLPPATLKTELAKTGDSYRLKISSPVLAKSIYISFGDMDAELSDNYFDLLPGQTAEITIKTKANEDALRSRLKVMSLVDAFSPDVVPKPAATTGLADPNWVK
jgi:beta-mannosidase